MQCRIAELTSPGTFVPSGQDLVWVAALQVSLLAASSILLLSEFL